MAPGHCLRSLRNDRSDKPSALRFAGDPRWQLCSVIQARLLPGHLENGIRCDQASTAAGHRLLRGNGVIGPHRRVSAETRGLADFCGLKRAGDPMAIAILCFIILLSPLTGRLTLLE